MYVTWTNLSLRLSLVAPELLACLFSIAGHVGL